MYLMHQTLSQLTAWSLVVVTHAPLVLVSSSRLLYQGLIMKHSSPVSSFRAHSWQRSNMANCVSAYIEIGISLSQNKILLLAPPTLLSMKFTWSPMLSWNTNSPTDCHLINVRSFAISLMSYCARVLSLLSMWKRICPSLVPSSLCPNEIRPKKVWFLLCVSGYWSTLWCSQIFFSWMRWFKPDSSTKSVIHAFKCLSQ